MPRATTNATDTEKFDLKSAPPDGYVVLRRMSYGEFLHRRSFTSDMKVRGGGKDFEGAMSLFSQKVVEYEFATCIVEHNLEDDGGELLDFAKPSTIKRLNPKIGEELSMLIDKMNQTDEDGEEALGN